MPLRNKLWFALKAVDAKSYEEKWDNNNGWNYEIYPDRLPQVCVPTKDGADVTLPRNIPHNPAVPSQILGVPVLVSPSNSFNPQQHLLQQPPVPPQLMVPPGYAANLTPYPPAYPRSRSNSISSSPFPNGLTNGYGIHTNGYHVINSIPNGYNINNNNLPPQYDQLFISSGMNEYII